MIKIFNSLQASVPSDLAGMNQYINESNAPIQINKHGMYLGPGEVAIAQENSHISRALKSGKLRNAGIVSAEENKPSKKSKKTEIQPEIEAETQEEASVELVKEELPQEDLVVATETTEA